jgi:hypothetical protein
MLSARDHFWPSGAPGGQGVPLLLHDLREGLVHKEEEFGGGLGEVRGRLGVTPWPLPRTGGAAG